MIRDILEQNANVAPNAEEVAVLHRYFPSCFTNEGKFDLDLFEARISESVDTAKEGYSLNFLGKDYARLIASMDTTTVIVPDEEHNAKPENKNSENIYISGDNLDALNHLLKSYRGGIKCIYIDPPYNTDSDDFSYNDKFSFTRDDLVTKLNISEEQAEKILDLTKRGSASHSAWLTFMAPRLQLARDLLHDDGVIFISINNNEFANLKLLCDAVFGEENFIEIFSWVKTSTPPSLSTKSRKTNEYVLCYEKVRNSFQYKGELLDGGDQPLLNSGNAFSTLSFPKDKIIFSSKEMRGKIKPYTSGRVSLLNEITILEDGHPDMDVQLHGEFKRTKQNLKDEIDAGTTFIIKSNLLSIRFIREGEGWKRPTNFIKETITSPLINKKSVGVGTNENASSELEDLFGKKVFSFPKPASLIKYLINFVVQPGDTVLDFFSGSGTTAEAVMKYNQENSDAFLKYILVQLPEDLQHKLKTADSQSKAIIQNGIDILDELGRPRFLDEIGQVRIVRAANKIRSGIHINSDLGFKHYTLKDVPKNTLDRMEAFNPYAITDELNIKDRFGVPTILTTWLVRDGYGFNAPVEEIKLDNYTAYACGQHLYFIDEGLDEQDVIELVDLFNRVPSSVPSTMVLFGYSFEYHNLELIKKNLRSIKIGEDTRKINIDVRY